MSEAIFSIGTPIGITLSQSLRKSSPDRVLRARLAWRLIVSRTAGTLSSVS